MTTSEAIDKLKEIQENQNGDQEQDHIDADQVLCDLLSELGRDDVVTEYKKIEKWWA